jgi:hypothetical protein
MNIQQISTQKTKKKETKIWLKKYDNYCKLKSPNIEHVSARKKEMNMVTWQAKVSEYQVIKTQIQLIPRQAMGPSQAHWTKVLFA